MKDKDETINTGTTKTSDKISASKELCGYLFFTKKNSAFKVTKTHFQLIHF
jgi:hypothetical protein